MADARARSAGSPDARADTARAHLAVLAREPRAAGSSAERRAREYCAERLRALGFIVREEPFEYSAAPGRWGTPAGGIAAIALVWAAAAAGATGRGVAASAILVGGGIALAAAATLLAHRGVSGLPFLRARGVNLVAERGTPRVWLVAHLDSKSQPVPIAVRALGVMASIAVWGAAVAAALTQALGRGPIPPWLAIAALAAVAGAPVAASVVRNRSPGALDDASGVATVLLAAEGAPREIGLGVLLTSAEELGLAGALAWARGRDAPGTAINVDGVDDSGGVRLTWTRRPPETLLAAFRRAAAAERLPLRTGRLVPGVLLDGVALANRGWNVVTLSKGSWRTVARIHTPRDALRALEGRGVALAARLTLRALDEFG
ncbi:MAG TPA: M28 family peptidase [Gemmatimonadaceae bacterium]